MSWVDKTIQEEEAGGNVDITLVVHELKVVYICMVEGCINA